MKSHFSGHLMVVWMVWQFVAGVLFGEPTLTHSPKEPRSGDLVRIEVKGGAADSPADWQLEIQTLEPGKYIPRNDPRYDKAWTSIDFQTGSPEQDFRVAVVPAVHQKHRNLVRYRLVHRGTRSVLAPKDEVVSNEAYFVHDGIPAWSGSAVPGSPKVMFPMEAMQSVQAYHVIARHDHVREATWKTQHEAWGDPERHAYRHMGTVVAHGRVYDHVAFRARGGQWRHSMGKNMWKFKFPKGHSLVARDDFGEPYPAKWNILNLGACIQQGSYGHRGEHGMFEAATFRLFNLAGSPAPLTHWVQLRIVSETEEAPADQYRGDFWGLYLAVENVDGDFIRDHDLPKDSLFKVEGGTPRFGYEATGGTTEAEAHAFARRLRSVSAARLIDLPSYARYRTIVDAVHHYDISFGKNYFFYRNPNGKKWRQIAWDVDLSWDDNMFGGHTDAFSAIWGDPEYVRVHANAIREIRDLLFNPEQTGALLDELASIIADPAQATNKLRPITFAEADRTKWDHHPIHSRIQGNTAPGLFYKAARNGRFSGMVQKMKAYASKRMEYLDSEADAIKGPPRPVLERSAVTESGFAAEIKSPDPKWKPLWHLGDVTPGGRRADGSRTRRSYEIETVWRTNGPVSVGIPPQLLRPGRSYRLRAKWTDGEGNEGHYSEPVGFTVPLRSP